MRCHYDERIFRHRLGRSGSGDPATGAWGYNAQWEPHIRLQDVVPGADPFCLPRKLMRAEICAYTLPKNGTRRAQGSISAFANRAGGPMALKATPPPRPIHTGGVI